MIAFQTPPKLVYDDQGTLVEVIVPAEDYLSYLRDLASESDWETLPAHLQDSIDRMLIDEVRGERSQAVGLDTILGTRDPG